MQYTAIDSCACLQVTGSVTYNGKGFDQFKAAHTAAYVDQNDLHQPELTVRETFDFAARCQGVGHKADELEELLKREKELGITPDPDMDAFMKAEIRTGKRESIVTDLIIKMLGLDVSVLLLLLPYPLPKQMLQDISHARHRQLMQLKTLHVLLTAVAILLLTIHYTLDSHHC